MSELNDTVNVTVDDATVITVPLVTNLTATNAAPTAKTVGDALAAKVDTDTIMEHVTIKVNDEQSDNQGQILLDASEIPISDGSTTSIKDAVDAVNAKTAADINYASGQTIKAKIDAVASDATTAGSKTAADITYDATASPTQSIKAKIDSLSSAVSAIGVENVKYIQNQGLTDDQKGYARDNIGAATAADVSAIQTSLTGKLSDVIPYNALDMSNTYPLPVVDEAQLASRLENSCHLFRFGPLVIVSIAFNANDVVPAGTGIAGFPSSYPAAAGFHCASAIWRNDGATSFALYRNGGVMATSLDMPAGFYRGFIVYGMSSSVWPIVN